MPSANKEQECTLRKVNCEMTFQFGPNNSFSFSTRASRVVVEKSLKTRHGVIKRFVLEPVPTITWNQQSGDVRIHDSYRAIDQEGRILDPAVYVARVLLPKAGKYFFEEPREGSGPDDIVMCFSRPEGLDWELPLIDVERLPTSRAQDLVLSQYRARWAEVRAIRVILHDGESCKYLPWDLVMACRSKAHATLAKALAGRAARLTASDSKPLTELPAPAVRTATSAIPSPWLALINSSPSSSDTTTGYAPTRAPRTKLAVASA